MENTKEIDIIWDGQPAKVKIKELTFAEDNEVRDASREIKTIGKEPIVKITEGRGRETALLKGIVDAPFPHATIEDIGKLPKKIGMQLFAAIDSFNEITEEKKDA